MSQFAALRSCIQSCTKPQELKYSNVKTFISKGAFKPIVIMKRPRSMSAELCREPTWGHLHVSYLISRHAKLPGDGGEKVAVMLWVLACFFTLHYIVWEVFVHHLWRCLGLSVRDWKSVSRQGGFGERRAWNCRLVFFQSLPHSSIWGPKRWGVWGGAYPDRNRHSEQSGGKIFKRAMKSRPLLNNIWSQGWLGTLLLGLSCLCNDSEAECCYHCTN